MTEPEIHHTHPDITEPPPKPKRMSEKRYYDLYDSTKVKIESGEGGTVVARFTAGAVSALVIARTEQRKGRSVTISPARN